MKLNMLCGRSKDMRFSHEIISGDAVVRLFGELYLAKDLNVKIKSIPAGFGGASGSGDPACFRLDSALNLA
jgi:hypothetical protein